MFSPRDKLAEEKAQYTYHGIECIVPGRDEDYGHMRDDWWWQAEPGMERASITFNLEAEFHFTHLWIEFKVGMVCRRIA